MSTPLRKFVQTLYQIQAALDWQLSALTYAVADLNEPVDILIEEAGNHLVASVEKIGLYLSNKRVAGEERQYAAPV